MGKIKIVCAMDGDGHYHAAKLSDRKAVWNILTKRIEDGCYWDDVWSDNDEEILNNYETISHKEWFKFINSHTDRGRMEIVEI